jgi:ferrous iron transport protein B
LICGKERLEGSLLGKAGRALEPASRWAGFDWRVNVALLSSLAAKENSVATLGALYEQTGGEDSLEDRISAQNTGFTPLHALTLMLFMVLYPPCIATSVAVKVQTGSYRWMLLSIALSDFAGFWRSGTGVFRRPGSWTERPAGHVQLLYPCFCYHPGNRADQKEQQNR